MVWVCYKEKLEAVRTVMEINVEGRRRKGRPNTPKRWVERYTRSAGVCIDYDVGVRVKWKFRVQVIDPKQLEEKRERRRTRQKL